MAHEDKDKGGYSSPHMKKVALAILVMGVSLLLVIVAWMGIGTHPNFSSNQMQAQQAALQEKYGLPSQETSTAELEVPPSLRGVESASGNATNATSGGNATGNATGGNATSAGNATGAANQTAGGNATATGNATAANQTAAGNQTSANQTASGNATSAAGNATGGNATGAGSGSALKASIVSGAASKTNDAFDPNPIKAKAGDTVTWTNDDSTPHTVTSGKGKPDGTFDSSTLEPGKSYSFMFEKAGDYPYFCTLHPTMVGTVSVS